MVTENRKFFLIKIALLVFFGVVLGLFIAEGLVRAFAVYKIIKIDKSISVDTRVFSSRLGYINKPYSSRIHEMDKYATTWHINKYGFRDFDYPSDTQGAFRILTLGDSMTFGMGVEGFESFPKVLETKLNKASGSSQYHEVINASALGYGPNEYQNLYQILGQKFDPKIIVVGFFLGNDSLDSLWVDLNKKYITLKALPDQVIPFSVNEWLKNHSFLWVFLMQNYYGLIETTNVDTLKLVFNGDIKGRMLREVQIDPSSQYMKKSWQLSETSLIKLEKQAAKNKAKMIILILPTREQIVPGEWAKVKEQGHNVESRLYSDSGSRKEMLKICKLNNWRCLDFQEIMRSQKDLTGLFLENDFHLSPQGHKLVADILFNYLSEKKLLEY